MYLGAEDFDLGMGCSPDVRDKDEDEDADADAGGGAAEEGVEVVSSATANSCRKVYP